MKIFTFSILLLSATLAVSSQLTPLQQKLANPLLHQKLLNKTNYNIIAQFAHNYSKQNTINSGWLGVFRKYNSGEALQNRNALDQKITNTQMIFDMDDDQPLDWRKVTIDKDNQVNFSPAQYVLSLETSNIEKKNSAVILILLSNQHWLNDYLSNPAAEELKKRGFTVAVMEYPNYGASLGLASLDTWLGATRGAVQFLNKLTDKKVFVVGHSIGGPLAIQAAADDEVNDMVAGVVTYGGFSNLYDMGKDNVSNPLLKLFSRPIVSLTLSDNIIDGIGHIGTLMEKSIPALILHGRHDGPVPVHHADLYQQQVDYLRDIFGAKANYINVHIFEDYAHEEINNYFAEMPESFDEIWKKISSFSNYIGVQ